MENETFYKKYISKLNLIEQKYSPKMIYFKGDFGLLEKERRVSVVGSRKVSELGIRRTEKIVKKLVENNIIVVSGLAEGVDTVAHTTAINKGGHTVAVIGTSLDKSYPKINAELQKNISERHLVISQFPYGCPSSPKNFPIRNRTMALISDATIIVEASENSGTRHQGWECLRLGRHLFIMENVATSTSWAKQMLDYGAEILTNENVDDLIANLPYLTSKEDYAF